MTLKNIKEILYRFNGSFESKNKNNFTVIIPINYFTVFTYKCKITDNYIISEKQFNNKIILTISNNILK